LPASSQTRIIALCERLKSNPCETATVGRTQQVDQSCRSEW